MANTATTSPALPSRVEVDGKTRWHFPKKEALEEGTKDYAHVVERAKKELKKHGLPGMSIYNVMLVIAQVMERFPEHKEDAIPYLTIKTFRAWKAEGRKVKKGERAMQSVTWIHPSYKDENGERIEDMDANMYPKTTHLFGVWQTEKA